MKKMRIKPASPNRPQAETDSGIAEQELDLSPILSLPTNVLQSGLIDQVSVLLIKLLSLSLMLR
jgi:hypothetical protein